MYQCWNEPTCVTGIALAKVQNPRISVCWDFPTNVEGADAVRIKHRVSKNWTAVIFWHNFIKTVLISMILGVCT